MSRRDAEIDDELASHLEMAMRDHLARGEAPREARRRALLELGNPTVAKEETRSVWAWTRLEQLATDLRIGARILWRAPGLSATAALLIALVIGGNMTIFSMVHAVLAKPASGIGATRLVTVGWVTDGEEHPVTSYPNYVDVAAASRTLKPILAQQFGRFVLTTRDGSYAVQGATVSTNYFDTLKIRLALGRSFEEREGLSGTAGLVAVISHHLWRERFGGTPTVIGQPMTINNHAATIVGVAPPDFQGVVFSEHADVWMPFASYAEVDGQRQILTDRLAQAVFMIGQLAPGVSLSQAQAELATIADHLPHVPGDRARTRTVQLFAYSATAAGDSLVAQRGPWFLALFSIVTALTVLIVYGNVANLMLARAVGRAREMAVRQSLGASRTRILRIFVAEGLAIGSVAWIAAAIVAFWATRAIPRMMPPLDGQGSRILFDFSPDGVVLGYALLLILIGVVCISAAPGLRAQRQALQPLLKAGEQGIVQGRSTISNGLVVLQLVFSVLLLTTAGLAYRSLSVLGASDLGLDTSQLLLVTINTRSAAATPQANGALLDAIVDRLRPLPGVRTVTYARRPVQSYWPTEQIAGGVAGQAFAAERDEVGPDYLRTMGLGPVAGVDFGERVTHQGAVAVLINQRLAEALWPGQPPVGRTLRLGSYAQPVEIVGVMPDAFYNGYRRQPDANFVLSSAAPQPQEMTLYVRYSGSLDDVVPEISRGLRAVDGRVPIVYTRTMDEQLEGLTWPIRALTVLLATFAIGSMLIAVMGQYAAMAFTMRRRVRDFGVRMALGASSDEILASATREGLRLTGAGLAIGGVLSVAAAHGLRSMLFGVTPTDARTYVGVVVLLGAASLVACYLPARRAARIDPMQALRDE